METTKDSAGFTIIELVIVIFIIGVLMTVGTLSLAGIPATARDSERADDIASIARKLEDDYTNQITGDSVPKPGYPAMNSFINDAQTGAGTAANTDPQIFRAPNSASISVIQATTTDGVTPAGSGSPAINQYYYQALTRDNLLCKDSSQTCASFRLFYRQEASKNVVILRSQHQQ